MARLFTLLLASLFHVGCLSAAGAAPPSQGGVTPPAEHLGRPVGVDFQLVDWGELSSWFELLGEQSARVQTRVEGQTTEGRDFLLSVISSEENLGRLAEIKTQAARLADPRGLEAEALRAAVTDGKVVLFISCAMHATECAAPQMAMELAYTLATSEDPFWAKVRDEVVVLLAPSLNPDGLDHVTSWYREIVGTPYEDAGLLKLYQYYAGHDNNRDWFMLTQNETRITTELLYRVWHPQVYWDVHQQGSARERFFVPPFRDPLNPNLDSTIITGIDTLGSRALFDLTRAGYTGVSTGVSYDMWWNGGNRNVPVRHNIIGLLTEAASVNLASPVFKPRSSLRAPRGVGDYAPSHRFPKPWPGGWWRLRDIIDYELAFARSLLGSVAREPELWRENALEASRRALEVEGDKAPRAWLIPIENRDVHAVQRLVDSLLLGGVEVHVAGEEVRADGRVWPEGSIVILRQQPYGTHVKDLFEVQRYPAGEAPYDIAGWTLPYLLGVHRVELMEAPEGSLRQVASSEQATAGFLGDRRVGEDELSLRDSGSWEALYEHAAEDAGWRYHPTGELAGLAVRGFDTPQEGGIELSHAPRIGLYSPWRGSMDEGWMRYAFDSHGIEFTSVRNEMLRAGRIRDFLDVLIIPSISAGQLDAGRSPGTIPDEYARGLDPEGAIAIEEFVREGGTLITTGSSSQWAIDLFEFPLVDVTTGEEGEGFSCPGSVLRAVPAHGAVIDDLPTSVPLFFSRSSAWREMTAEERKEARREEATLETWLRYAPSRVLLSGWIEKPETIEGRAAWVRASHGDGHVHLFGFRPHYRGWTQATIPLLFRTALLEANDG